MRKTFASLLVLGLACTGTVGSKSGGGGTSAGAGATGTGAAGTGTGTAGTGTGTAGTGTGTAGTGTGAAGTGTGTAGTGTGAAGTGAAGTGVAGTGAAGTGAGRGGTSGGAGRGGTSGGAGRGGTSGGAGRGGAAGTGAAGTGAAGTGAGGATGTGGAVAGSLFDLPHPWTTDVSAYPKATTSDTIINGLVTAGGWGGGGQFLSDASIIVLTTDGSAPMRTFTPSGDFYDPDCDNVPFPVPAGGALEGETGYACAGDGDCHLIVVAAAQKKLYEMWRANITGTSVAQFQGGCAAVWDLAKQYGPTLRGKGCTSADAGGFPITAMLATSDEVAAGQVKHALRFILPNERIRDGIYVPPGTHSTFPTSGGPNTPPYGVRFRLKAAFDTSALSSGAKVLAQALKTYGMFLSDGGDIALTIASDRFSSHKWSSLGLSSNSALASLKVTDFEVVDYGTEVNWKANTDCIRNP